MNARINRMQPAISALTHISADVAHPSLFVQTKDGKRYLFGRIGEGFQRTLVQSRIKSTKISGIFLSGPLDWSSVSGLPGYLLSIAEAHKVPAIHTGLPERAQAMRASWRNFTFHNPLDIEIAVPPDFQDNNLIVQSVLLPSASPSASPSTASEPAVEGSTSYIIQMLPTRGKFLVNKARELGVPPGALFGKLSNGETVTTPEGRVVEPSQVLEPAPTPARVLVLDLPTEKHIEAALEYPWAHGLKRKRGDSDYDVVVSVVYYFLGPETDLSSPALAALSEKFKNAKQYLSHPQTSPDYPTLASIVSMQAALRKEFPFFVKPYSAPAAVDLPGSGLNLIPLQEGDTVSVPTSVATDSVNVLEHVDVDNDAASFVFPENEPAFVTLGTGSSAPSKYRNVSSTFVRVPTHEKARGILLDCGEATLNSLKRLYGPEGVQQRLREIDTIYISHMHADHHLGLLTMIRAWQQANPDKTLMLYGPERIYEFVSEWCAINNEVDMDRLKFVDLEDVIVGRGYRTLPPQSSASSASSTFASDSALDAASPTIRTCRAYHCDRSYNAEFTYQLSPTETFRFAYSGDSRPNRFFAQMAKGCDVLVHEATHEDELAAEAKAKRHSTISEALEIGAEMAAKHIVLTHFSQRYPGMPALQSVTLGSPTCFGFDGLHVAVSQIASIQASMGRVGEIIDQLVDREPEDSSS